MQVKACLAVEPSETHPARRASCHQRDQASSLLPTPTPSHPLELPTLHDSEDQRPSPGYLQEVHICIVFLRFSTDTPEFPKPGRWRAVRSNLLLITRGYQFLAGGFK